MILQRLAAYYDRLLADGDVEAPGFESKEILWVVELDAEGGFVSLIPTGDGKKRGKKFVVPSGIKKSVNIAANLLWENAEYALGAIRAGADEKQAAKVPLRHAAFIDRLKSLPESLRADDGVAAVLKFLTEGDRSGLLADDRWEDLAGGGANVSFRLSGDDGLVCERPAIRAGLAVTGDAEGSHRCLVTGRLAKPARLHPSIKGVRGAQSSGASLVSFNDPAYRSHGWEQGDNAPVSEQAAQAYGAALNYLLSNTDHYYREGDSTFVFWAAAPSKMEVKFPHLMGGFPDTFTSDGKPVKETFINARNGIRPFLDEKTPFYVLGLAPNAARLAVNYWYHGTVGEMARNISAHFDDLAIDGLDQAGYPAIWRLMGCAAPESDPKRLGDELRKRLSGQLMTAILENRPYPATLLARTVERCRLEHSVRPMRAALIKAILSRPSERKISERKITVSLDENDRNPGYLLGRLFAVLENIQRTAQPDINTTIRDRYFGGAMAAPRGVFVRLSELKNAHLKKIARDKPGGLVTWFERRIDSIVDGFVAEKGMPQSLTLDDQARFVLGYHHERSYRSDAKPAEIAAADQEE